MARELEYLAEALEEAEAAARWYHERSAAAAAGFSDEIDLAESAILDARRESEATMMGRRITLAKLEKKLSADKSAILSASEVRLLTRELQRHMAASFPALVSDLLPRADDTVRWHSLEARCRQARATRGLSMRDVAALLHIPQYRLKAIERGALRELRADMARRYFRFLEIDAWIARWCRANADLARRVGLLDRPRDAGPE